jgi:hypothetical protein
VSVSRIANGRVPSETDLWVEVNDARTFHRELDAVVIRPYPVPPDLIQQDCVGLQARRTSQNPWNRAGERWAGEQHGSNNNLQAALLQERSAIAVCEDACYITTGVGRATRCGAGQEDRGIWEDAEPGGRVGGCGRFL